MSTCISTNCTYIAYITSLLKEENLLKVQDIFKLRLLMSAWPEVRGTADTDGGAYSPVRSILLVLTHDFIITQLYGPACGDG